MDFWWPALFLSYPPLDFHSFSGAHSLLTGTLISASPVPTAVAVVHRWKRTIDTAIIQHSADCCSVHSHTQIQSHTFRYTLAHTHTLTQIHTHNKQEPLSLKSTNHPPATHFFWYFHSVFPLCTRLTLGQRFLLTTSLLCRVRSSNTLTITSSNISLKSIYSIACACVSLFWFFPF